jgi:glycosyltransferase involved in cell wall biosynthesis
VQYAPSETRDGVEIRRLPFSSFGKKSIPRRLLGGVLFMLQCIVRGLFMPRLEAIMVSTSPPMCAAAAMVIAFFRRVPIKYWVMDLNPDQMIELGKLKADALPVKLYDAFNRMILNRSADVVALDRFMATRLNRKLDVSHKLAVMPPWPHDDHLGIVAHEDNPFRKQHGLDGKFVVMYSGNHGFSTPVKTVVDAALKLQDRTDIVFMFIGGGVGKKEVDQTIEREKPANIRSLPYQPFKDLRYSLSAADVHMVTVGNDVVGVVHPCKIYGAMAVSRPILLVAPDPCHASDIVRDNNAGWHIPHGDIDGAVRLFRQIARTPKETLAEMGRGAQRFVEREMSKDVLCGRFCDIVEQGVGGKA